MHKEEDKAGFPIKLAGNGMISKTKQTKLTEIFFNAETLYNLGSQKNTFYSALPLFCS